MKKKSVSLLWVINVSDIGAMRTAFERNELKKNPRLNAQRCRSETENII